MPYLTVTNRLGGLSASDKQELLREFDALRTELNEIRGAYMALRALLVAATAPGAGYNTNGTNLGTAASTNAATVNRFTPT